MLDSETRQVEASADYPKVISWSESGKAFRIYNVAEFCEVTLPKYFRTKKFSSFQRNLNLVSFLLCSSCWIGRKTHCTWRENGSYAYSRNLPRSRSFINFTQYGFAKVRRGPDSDMYAHPSFMRDRPDFLLHLRKTGNGARRRVPSPPQATSAHSPRAVPPPRPTTTTAAPPNLRPVSPSTSSRSSYISSPVMVDQVVITSIPRWTQHSTAVPKVSPVPTCPATIDDKGKLHLLALALEKASAI